MRAAAGELWEEHLVVFSRPDGRPLDPRQDYEEVKELLAEGGIHDRRLYDASRHTARTILNEPGVDMPTIMEILRHTQISQTRRYVKGRYHLSKDAMRRTGEFFMPSPQSPAPSPSQSLPPTSLRAPLRPQLRPPTPARPAPAADATSAEQQNPSSGRSELGFRRSPPSESKRRPTHYKTESVRVAR